MRNGTIEFTRIIQVDYSIYPNPKLNLQKYIFLDNSPQQLDLKTNSHRQETASVRAINKVIATTSPLSESSLFEEIGVPKRNGNDVAKYIVNRQTPQRSKY